jgi:hypothetical protein
MEACLLIFDQATEQVSPEDRQENAFAASLSNNVVEQSDEDVSYPLALIDPFYYRSFDPFAIYPSAFPPELVNSCIMYRKY